VTTGFTKNFVVKNGLTTGNIILDAGSSNITANTVVANLSVPASANLGAVGNIIITGGSSGQYLQTNGAGGLTWASAGSSGAIVNSAFIFNEFTANGVQNAFTLSSTPDSINQILVNYNGVLQNQSAYTLSGNIVTFTETPVNTAKIDVMVVTGTAPANSLYIPQGSSGSIQFTNSSGALAASANLTFATSSNTLSTGNLVLSGTANVHDVNITGNMVPTVANTYNLGSPTNYYKSIYVGPGSLYVDGQKVLQSNSGTIVVSADVNQDLDISTSGSGGIRLNPTGSGIISLQGTIQIQGGNHVTSSDGNPIVFTNAIDVDNIGATTTNGDLTLAGNGSGNVHINSNSVVTGTLSITGTGNLVVGNTITAAYYIGNGSQLTGIVASTATTANTVTGNSQSNITSVGTLTSLTVSGLTTATGNIRTAAIQDTSGTTTLLTKYNNNSGDIGVYGNIVAGTSGTGNVTASYHIGNGSLLSSITGSNVTGQVGNALVAGTVYTAAQPSITSLGNLTIANVTGNLTTTGWLSMQQATETLNTKTGATGTVNHDISTGAVFIHTGISANFTTNLQNVPTTNSQVISVTLFLNQGSTPYYANAVQINGGAATLLWPSATAPTPTANRYETETFTLVRTSGGAWQVYGSYNSFG